MELDNLIAKIEKSVTENLPKIVGEQKKKIIQNKGAYNGRDAWDELAPSTKRKKRSDVIWVDSGDTESKLERGDLEALEPYTEFVDKGTKNIPARPLLNFTDEDMIEITRRLKEELEKDLK